MPDIKTGNITISGLSDLEKRLQEFTDKLAKNILKGAVRAGAVIIQREARQLAPVSAEPHSIGKKGRRSYVEEVQPGHLRKHVRTRLAPRKYRDEPITYWIYVSGKAWYWKFIEFGTSKMSSKPFMRPAFDTMKEKATERIREYLSARIEKEAENR
jgi:HK97 gp10 family phage protein